MPGGAAAVRTLVPFCLPEGMVLQTECPQPVSVVSTRRVRCRQLGCQPVCCVCVCVRSRDERCVRAATRATLALKPDFGLLQGGCG